MKISFHLIKTVLKNKSIQNSIKKQFVFILLGFIFLPQILSAQNKKNTIWIKEPQMPLQEFKAHIKALGHPHISYAQYQFSQKREQAKFFQLKDKLLSAQKLYLSGEGEKAVQAFQKISQLALLADWDKEDRRIILYSFLRQAQSEEDTEKRKALLLSASDFSLVKINELNYQDYHLFPPPLMNELKNIQDKSNTLWFDWKTIFSNHEIVLINGKLLQDNEKIKMPQAFYRVSAFSSSHQPWSQRLNLSKLLTKKIKTQSLTKGICGNLSISSDKKEKNMQVVPFSACPLPTILSFEKGKPTKTKVKKTFIQKATLKNSQLHTFQKLNQIQLADSYLPYPKNLQDKLKELPSKKKKLFSSVPSWVVFGVGVVVLSLAISLSQSKKPTPTTTTSGDYIY